MVLSKMNNHEHRTNQTYESYTFQPLMGFWLDSVGFYPIRRDKVEFSFGGVVSLRNLGLTSHNNTKRCSDLLLP